MSVKTLHDIDAYTTWDDKGPTNTYLYEKTFLPYYGRQGYQRR
jgi:hypothetical protein